MSFKVNSACWDNLYNTIGKMYLMYKTHIWKFQVNFYKS